MGVVYRAQDVNLPRSVALKFLPPEMSRHERAVSRFKQEATAASSLDHPNIAVVHEIDRTPQGQLFIAMSFYDGETIKKKVERGPLPLDTLFEYALGVTNGLGEAHRHGIVHRDVKPANVMVTRRGDVKLLDFGVAKVADLTTMTPSGTTVGTIAYMSPEQARGEHVDARSDIWSTGVLLYEMLTGRRPFTASYEQAIIYQILNERPTDATDLRVDAPPDLLSIIERCLAKNPDERFASMTELSAELRAISCEPTVLDVRPPPPRPVKPSTKWLIAGVSTSVVASIALLVMLSRIVGCGTPPPADATIAVLPFETIGFELPFGAGQQIEENTLVGLHASLVDDLGRLLRRDGRKGSIVSLEEMQDAGIETIEDAQSTGGIQFAIASQLSQGADEHLTVSTSLIRIEDGYEIGHKTLATTQENLGSVGYRLQTSVAELLELTQPPPEELAPGAAQYYTQALGYLRNRDNTESLQAAMALFQNVLEERPDFALAHVGLGEASLHLFGITEEVKWVKEAQLHAERANEVAGGLPESHNLLGHISVEQGMPATARGHFDVVLSIDSLNLEALAGIARSFEKTAPDSAEALYKQLIRKRPDYWSGYNNLGVLYYEQSRFADAVQQWQIVNRLAPLNSRGYQNLGAAYWYLGDIEKAEVTFAEGMKRAPSAGIASNLATLYFYQFKDYENAAEMFEQVIRLGESDYLYWGNLGFAYKRADGNLSRARGAWNKAVELAEERINVNRSDVSARSKLISYLANLSQVDAALDHIAEIEKTDVSSVSGEEAMTIGGAYELLGRREDALRWIRAGIAKGHPLTELIDDPDMADLRDSEEFGALLALSTSQDEGGN